MSAAEDEQDRPRDRSPGPGAERGHDDAPPRDRSPGPGAERGHDDAPPADQSGGDAAAQPPPPAAADPIKLYVGNLSWQTDDLALTTAFSKFGKAYDCRVIKDRETDRSR
jgi:hypothetical protein